MTRYKYENLTHEDLFYEIYFIRKFSDLRYCVLGCIWDIAYYPSRSTIFNIGHFNSWTFIRMYIFVLQFVEENLGVMSVGFLLSSPDDAVIWRGPKKNGQQFTALHL